MKAKSCYCILILFLLFMPRIVAQSTRYLPKITPQAPNTSAFIRYGVYEVNLFTGVPDISIPLYEVQAGDLKVPVSLKYHASGIKITDNASWVGLGWSINAGGLISRKLMGGPDELQGNYLSGAHILKAADIDPFTQTGLDVLNLIRNGSYDMEPDIFAYNMPGHSGSFFFNQRDSYKPVLMPYEPVVINKTIANSQISFDLLDETGAKYKFGATAVESSNAYSGSTNTYAKTAWMLEQMVSSNYRDTINFTYTSRSGQTAYDEMDYIIVNDNVSKFTTDPGYNYDQGMSYNTTYSANTTQQLSNEITFPNGKLVFEQSTADRQDSYLGDKLLTGIKVYNINSATGQYQVLKQIKFYQSYFYNDFTYRLRLDSMAVMDKGGIVMEMYRFEYNTDVQLPRKISKSRDYWGYYNGKTNNTLVPRIQIPFTAGGATGNSTITIGSSTDNGRDPDPAFMQAYMLKKIYYPTGGYTEFEFETNKYQDNQNNIKYAGGLRVSKISSTDGVRGTPTVTSYQYGDNGYGRENFILENNFFQTTRTAKMYTTAGPAHCMGLASQKRVRTFVATPSLDIEPFDAAAVVYPLVTVYNGDKANNAGKTVYKFTDRSDALTTASFVGRPIVTNYSFDRGKVTEKTVYKRDAVGQYAPVTANRYSYSAFQEQFYDYVALVADKHTTADAGGGTDVPLSPYDPANGCNAVNDSYNFLYTDYAIRSDDNHLTKEEIVVYDEFDPNKMTTVSTEYFYDNFAHQQVTRQQETDSKGKVVLTTNKYPHEMVAAGSTTPYTDMISRNMISEKAREITTLNGTTISQTLTDYKSWPGNIIEPLTVKTATMANAPETEISFNEYDANDNLLQYISAAGGAASVIWGYNNRLAIAKVENAGAGEIAYTSFEADGKGNWNYTYGQTADATSITGGVCHALSGKSLSKSGLNSTKQYTVSFWYKSGASVSVSGGTSVSSITGSTVDGWTYREVTVANTSSVTISGSGYIDEVRLYPQKAQMTTYCYQPGLGVTAICGPDNMVTYYEYDSYNRLKLIRNQNKDIIRYVNYQYNSQQ